MASRAVWVEMMVADGCGTRGGRWRVGVIESASAGSLRTRQAFSFETFGPKSWIKVNKVYREK